MSLKQHRSKVLAVAIAILLFVLLLLVPRTPADTPSVASTHTHGAVDDEIQEALRMVQGENPMQGILKLRTILEEDPANVEVAWTLGRFSIETGQYENAIKRLNQVLEHGGQERYPDTFIYLGHAYEQTGNAEQAIGNYNRFLESESDPQLMEEVRKRVEGLNKK